MGAGIDSVRHRVEPQADAGGLEVGDGAVCEVVPVADIARDVVRDAADREVRIGVGEHHCDVCARVKLAGAKRCHDARVATPDRDQSHRRLPGGNGGAGAAVAVREHYVGSVGGGHIRIRHPANVLENMRPIVIAGLAKLVELVNQ